LRARRWAWALALAEKRQSKGLGMSGPRLARKARFLRWAMNFYPPYIGAGVRVRHISADMRLVQVKMVLRWYNRNYVGTQFGGSLYSMVDPFFVLMLMENLGRDYIVWRPT